MNWIMPIGAIDCFTRKFGITDEVNTRTVPISYKLPHGSTSRLRVNFLRLQASCLPSIQNKHNKSDQGAIQNASILNRPRGRCRRAGRWLGMVGPESGRHMVWAQQERVRKVLVQYQSSAGRTGLLGRVQEIDRCSEAAQGPPHHAYRAPV